MTTRDLADIKQRLKMALNPKLDKEKKNNFLSRLQQIPPRAKGEEVSKWSHVPPKPYTILQIDNLYLPIDKGYGYLTVVVDVSTREVDMTPIKRNPTAKDDVVKGLTQQKMIEAMKEMFETEGKPFYHHYPNILCVDNGSEFKGEFRTYCKSKGITIKA